METFTIETVLVGIVLLGVGVGLWRFGFRAIVSPDVSYSRWVSSGEEDGDVFGEWAVLWLVRGMGVVFVLVGLIAGLFGVGVLVSLLNTL